jgi:hypothetical protein
LNPLVLSLGAKNTINVIKLGEQTGEQTNI